MNHNIKGIIFDYGGTIDSRGDHWSEVIFDKYEALGVPVSYEQFRPAYIHAERELARTRHILPCDTFADVMSKKIRIEFDFLESQGLLPHAGLHEMADSVAALCYAHAREAVDEARGPLERLAEHYPMALVSNFYGNIDTVLRDFGLRRLFAGVVESAVIGIRKPDPRIFAIGCMVLDLKPEEVLVVGDSVDKDLLPAESLGCPTAWVAGRQWRGTPVPEGREPVTPAALARHFCP